jgi:hypothetical protein
VTDQSVAVSCPYCSRQPAAAGRARCVLAGAVALTGAGTSDRLRHWQIWYISSSCAATDAGLQLVPIRQWRAEYGGSRTVAQISGTGPVHLLSCVCCGRVLPAVCLPLLTTRSCVSTAACHQPSIRWTRYALHAMPPLNRGYCWSYLCCTVFWYLCCCHWVSLV